jgi:hypothetical protein
MMTIHAEKIAKIGLGYTVLRPTVKYYAIAKGMK